MPQALLWGVASSLALSLLSSGHRPCLCGKPEDQARQGARFWREVGPGPSGQGLRLPETCTDPCPAPVSSPPCHARWGPQGRTVPIAPPATPLWGGGTWPDPPFWRFGEQNLWEQEGVQHLHTYEDEEKGAARGSPPRGHLPLSSSSGGTVTEGTMGCLAVVGCPGSRPSIGSHE